MAKILVILPKLNSYQYKSPDEKRRSEDVITKGVNKLIARNMEVFMLREDMLALHLYGNDSRIQWLTGFTERDTRFMISCVSDYPEIYKTIKAKECSEKIMSQLKSKIKVKTKAECNNDIDAYMIARLNSLQDKISLTVKLLMQSYKNILEFRGSSNYCDQAIPSLGDGRLIISTNINTSLTTMHYGGCAIEAEQMEQILEVI